MDDLSSQGRWLAQSDRGRQDGAALPAGLQPRLQANRKAFSKLKAAARSGDALWNWIGALFQEFTPAECANFFVATGHELL